MNRLTQAIYPQGREVLAYDYADNRISREYFEKTGYNKERLSSRETYQYDECNRLVRCIEEVGEIPEQLDIFGFDTGMGKENPYPSENNIAGMVMPESNPFTSDSINDGISAMSENISDIATSINAHASDSKQTALPQGYKRNVVDYVYDKQGNLLKDGNAEYSYDLFNRLEKAETFNGDVQKNRYDAEGLRHEMEENGRLVQFLYSGKEVVAEKEDDGNVIRYIRGYQLISSDNEKAKVYYHYASNELGSVTHIVNGNVKRSPYKLEYGMRIAGSDYDKKEKKNNCFSIINRKKVADNDFRVMNRYEYDAFGNTVKCEEKVHNRFRFAGEQYDPLTQQYYLRARFYNPVIGRFIQEDNYYGDGLNLYAYCKNNPVRYVDPSGHGTTSAADKAKNVNDLKDYVDELNEQGGVTPEDAEVLKELAEEFDLDPNELDIQIKQNDTPVKPNDAGKADNQSIPSDENMITRYANEYGLDSDSLGVSDGQDSAKSSGESGSSSNGIVNGKTPASRLADKLRGLSNSKRPNTVAVIRTADGKYYIGYNKAGIYDKQTQEILDGLGNVNDFNRQCAEVNAVSRALKDEANLEGATISIAHVRGVNNKSGVHGTYKKPCNVCQPLLDYLNIADIQ